MTAKTEFVGIDLSKLLAAILVITIHTGPLVTYSEQSNFLLTSIVARIAVPFFFMAAGFLLFRKLQAQPEQGSMRLRAYTYKVGVIYALSILFYLPVSLYAGHYEQGVTFSAVVRDVIFNGTFYHLWYLPALIVGIFIVYYLSSRLSMTYVLVVTGLLYLIGLLGDSYYGLIVEVPVLNEFYGLMFQLFDYTRNGVFFAPIFLALGLWVSRHTRLESRKHKSYAIYLIISLILLIIEGYLVKSYDLPRHDSMYVFLLPVVYILFRWLLTYRGKSGGFIRPISLWIYILHPIAIVLVRGFGDFTGLQSILIRNSVFHFITVTLVTICLSILAILLLRTHKKVIKDISYNRAWREISLENLEHNLLEMKRLLPAKSQLMAVVKADAYGHGSAEVARHLYQLGVRFFAVADITEGIHLRKRGLNGDILVLGETCESRVDELIRYKLQQTVISAEYGDCLQQLGRRIRVHVKIDTGMNRMGEDYVNKQQLQSIYQHNNLQVIGTYSHLSVSDSLLAEDTTYTQDQFHRFNHAVDELIALGIDPGILHVQSSYGIINYSDNHYPMARAGISLYGVLSHRNAIRHLICLKPVLALRARVALVKQVSSHKPIGYGHDCITNRESIIATVSIGYADGIPRSLSNQGGSVLIRGQAARILGKICMDYILVDVTDIEEAKRGDIATLIGQDGDAVISAEEVAEKCGTITNELLCRIGSRVERLYR